MKAFIIEYYFPENPKYDGKIFVHLTGKTSRPKAEKSVRELNSDEKINIYRIKSFNLDG